MFNFIFTPDIVVSIIAAFFVLFTGFFVVTNNFHSTSNKTFFFLSVSIVIWILSVVFRFNSAGLGSILLNARISFAGAGLVMFFLFLFTYYFPLKNNYKLPVILTLVSGVISSMLFVSPLTVTNISIGSSGQQIDTYGIGYYFFILFFLFLFFLSAYNLIYKYRSLDSAQKTQIQYVLVGSLLSLLFGFTMNVLVPYLTSVTSGARYGPASASIFILLTSIAILKHHMFNIKVIATELFVFTLWVFILARILVSDKLSDIILNTGLLVTTLIVGILLIRSVIKEVSLRERIEKLANDLQKANDRLRELDKQKSEFVSFATHQLRAPLTAMKGYASLILEGDLGKISKDIRGAITRIFDSSNTLANIVDDYLNISRIELGTMKYTFEPIDLKELLDHVLGELRPNIEKSNLGVTLNVDREKKYVVTADKDKFKQIIANLVDNAVKYTPVGSIVISLVKKGEGASKKIVFSVKDNGIGIAPEVMPKLFAKFSRAENGNRANIHGTGLGLFVAKQIVEAHKGKIWAESPGEGKGSTFFVELDEVI